MPEQSYPRDLIGYGRNPPHPKWPGEARICVQFVINYEEGGENNVLHGDAASEGYLTEVATQPWPSMRHMSVESVYEYGSRAGFWRLWRMFSQRGWPVTVYGVAMALERNPEAVAAMNEAGWEIASHGLRWIEYRDFTPDAERAHLDEAIRVHKAATGERPLGWYTGRTSVNSLRLVAEEGGFLYSADSYADELPYWTDEGAPLLIVPYTLDANDMRFATNPGYPSGPDFYEYLKDSFDVLYAEGESAPKMMSIGLHCRLAGRPGRAAALARFLDYIGRHERVWIARRVDIARHWIGHHRPANVSPSRMTRAVFVEVFGDVFEHSSWVAEGAHIAGLTQAADSADGLHAAMSRIVRDAPHEKQLALLRAHPDLAGRIKVADMTADSQAEQTGSGLTQLSEAERQRFLALNETYRAKFGFPFIIAVKARTKADILSAFEERIANEPHEEFATALREVEKIALLRLRDRLPG
jgi:OHCU decarboxylase